MPGLAICALGELTPDKVAATRESCAIPRKKFVRSGFARSAGQFFAASSDIRSVGVMGDRRSDVTAAAIRAVPAGGFMTADRPCVSCGLLVHISRRIANGVLGVNRVLLDVTTRPPASIQREQFRIVTESPNSDRPPGGIAGEWLNSLIIEGSISQVLSFYFGQRMPFGEKGTREDSENWQRAVNGLISCQ